VRTERRHHRHRHALHRLAAASGRPHGSAYSLAKTAAKTTARDHPAEIHCAAGRLPYSSYDVLRVEAQIDFKEYSGLDPIYTEYNVGPFQRAFTLGSKIDQEKISAQLDDGVLTLTLKKTKEATPRSISIS
jgi:hypothetical protein